MLSYVIDILHDLLPCYMILCWVDWQTGFHKHYYVMYNHHHGNLSNTDWLVVKLIEITRSLRSLNLNIIPLKND